MILLSLHSLQNGSLIQKQTNKQTKKSKERKNWDNRNKGKWPMNIWVRILEDLLRWRSIHFTMDLINTEHWQFMHIKVSPSDLKIEVNAHVCFLKTWNCKSEAQRKLKKKSQDIKFITWKEPYIQLKNLFMSSLRIPILDCCRFYPGVAETSGPRPCRAVLRLVALSCPTHCDPMDCSPPGSSVHGILQARILDWVAMPSSRASSQPRDQTKVSHIASRFFTICATREVQEYWSR